MREDKERKDKNKHLVMYVRCNSTGNWFYLKYPLLSRSKLRQIKRKQKNAKLSSFPFLTTIMALHFYV